MKTNQLSKIHKNHERMTLSELSKAGWLKKACGFFAVIVISLNISFAQSNIAINIASGFGLPDAFHLGAKMQFTPKNQMGIYYGAMSYSGLDNGYSITLDHQFHFGTVSEFSNRPVWFFRQAVSFAREESSYERTRYIFANLAVGREFNLSDNVGCSIDFGFFRPVVEKETIKDPNQEPWIDLNLSDWFVLPSARFQIFYSL